MFTLLLATIKSNVFYFVILICLMLLICATELTLVIIN